MKFLKKTWGFLKTTFGKKLVVVYMEDLPDNLSQRTVYLLGSIDAPWCLAMMCPCGCKEVIQLSLLEDDSPRWTFSLNSKGLISVTPSIWRVRGCKSHFFVKKGMILFCVDPQAERTRLPETQSQA